MPSNNNEKFRSRLLYKVASGSFDLITAKDVISWSFTYGIIIGFLFFCLYAIVKHRKKHEKNFPAL